MVSYFFTASIVETETECQTLRGGLDQEIIETCDGFCAS